MGCKSPAEVVPAQVLLDSEAIQYLPEIRVHRGVGHDRRIEQRTAIFQRQHRAQFLRDLDGLLLAHLAHRQLEVGVGHGHLHLVFELGDVAEAEPRVDRRKHLLQYVVELDALRAFWEQLLEFAVLVGFMQQPDFRFREDVPVRRDPLEPFPCLGLKPENWANPLIAEHLRP